MRQFLDPSRQGQGETLTQIGDLDLLLLRLRLGNVKCGFDPRELPA